MTEQDTETGKFVKKDEPAPRLQHPALRKKTVSKKLNAKLRRTTVRMVKLVGRDAAGGPLIGQYPIEPSFNNGGNLNDPMAPLRYWLDQGLEWPHECEELPLEQRIIFCALMDCWQPALVNADPESGTERCLDHEAAWRAKQIRYASTARG